MRAAFSVHLNGFPALLGSFTGRDYEDIPWEKCDWNIGGYFDLATGCWQPPPGLLLFTHHLFFRGDTPIGGNPEFITKIYRSNNQGAKWLDGKMHFGSEAQGWQAGDTGGPANASGAQLQVNPGGYWYKLSVVVSSKADGSKVILDGHPAHTWWQGCVLG